MPTKSSHNSKEAIKSSTIVAMIIYLARKGFTKEEILKELNIDLSYNPFARVNTTCNDTISNCLYALFTSNNFDESLRKVIFFGGDTDTNACIVGSMAEALYGIDESLIEKASEKIPKEFVKTLNLEYGKII